MAVKRYRYKQTAGAGFSAAKLIAETDASAVVFGSAQAQIIDVSIEETFLDDLDETMLFRGYTRIGTNVSGSPGDNVDVFKHDFKDSVRATSTVDLVAAGWTTAGGPGYGATLTSPTTLVGNNTHDGVALVVGNRFLFKDGAAGNAKYNGIYTLTQAADGGANPAIFTRAVDFDEDAEVTQGAYTAVSEGTLSARKMYQLTTVDPIVVDTTALTFQTITATDAIVAGAGLSRVVDTLAVELDTTANAQGAGTAGGSSGLEFDVAGDAGKLRAAVNPTGGLDRTASGLAVLNDPAGALSSGAAGEKVNVDGSTVKISGNQLIAGADQLSFGNGSIAATTTPRFLAPWYDSSLATTTTIQLRMVRAGTMKNLRIRHTTTAGNGNNVVYTVRKNGVNQTLTVTLASTASDGTDLVNSFAVAAGDLIDVIVTKAASIGASPSDVLAEMELAA